MKPMPGVLASAVLVIAAVAANGQAPAASEGKEGHTPPEAQVTLTGHTPAQVLDGRAMRVSHYDPEKKLRLALGIHVPHMAEEEQFLADLQDKQSPHFHQFLSAEEWNARFAPSAEDEQKIVDWAESQGLTVTNRFANRLLVDLEAPVGVIEKVFNVTINNYQVDDEVDFSNDRDPAIPALLSGNISAVLGMNSIQRARRAGSGSSWMKSPDYVPGPVYSVGGSSQGDGDPSKAPWNQAASTDSVQSNSLTPDLTVNTAAVPPSSIFSSQAYDYDALYALGHCCNPHHDAIGSPPDSSIALVTLGSFQGEDANTFFKAYGMAWNYTVFSINAGTSPGTECLEGSSSCTLPGQDDEAPLDIEYSTASANSFGSSKDTAHVYVYEVINFNYSTYADAFNFILSDGHARVVSTSYGWSESSFTTNELQAYIPIFHAMAGSGWTLIAAAGDSGSTAGCQDKVQVLYPASDPDFVAAGGTELSLYTDGGYAGEVAWTGQTGSKACGTNHGGGGGGVSSIFTQPPWQSGLGGSMRLLPDFSLNASGIAQLYYCSSKACKTSGINGWAGVGGTSIVAPELAGFFAQENAYLAFIGNKCGPNGTSRCDSIGNPNPLVYDEAMHKNAAHDPFYDILHGCNSNNITIEYHLKSYCAHAGYDEATGWGSANMLQLAWAINWELTKADGTPSITFTGPEKNKWYNTNQAVDFTIHDYTGPGHPGSIGTGIAGWTAAWDALPNDPRSEPTPGGGNSFYTGPKFPNQSTGCLSFEPKSGCESFAVQGCHTAYARGWNNQGWSTADNRDYPETYGPICFDNVPPNLLVTNDPATPVSTWNTEPVKVYMSATDPGGSNASGVRKIYYYVYGNDKCSPATTSYCSEYSAPISVRAPGEYITAFAMDNAGNASYLHDDDVKIDPTPPVTKASLSGTQVSGQWQSAVTVKLTATDNLSGVQATHYSLDGGATVKYSSSFQIDAVGSHSLSFWSVDWAGNIESANSQTITIYSPTTVTLTASANPSVIGQSVTFTATVTPTVPGIPTGTVIFFSGTTTLSTGPLTGGVATYSTAALPLGSNELQATYTGASYDLPATSQMFTESVINPPNATATSPAVTFNPAAIGIAAGSAQTLTASFTVTNYTGSFTPTAVAHYGHDYALGAVNCTGGSGSETCTVPVTFLPTLPGARKDAVQLMAGSTILATELLGGTGQGPMALIDPSVVTSPISKASYYIYQSVVDENGTVYFVVDNGNAIYSLAKGSSTPSLLPITGLNSPHGIDIDGAGTLYIAQGSSSILTYNTVTGVQGAISVIPPAPYMPCSTAEYLYSVAFDDAGNLFAPEWECGQIFELKADGSYSTTAVDPTMIGLGFIAVDAADNVFVSGYDINELTAGGVQTQINTVGATEGLQVDAADTLYATRYTGMGGVEALLASNYSTSAFGLDPTASPLGEGLGSDGTLYVSNYNNLDKVDRSQGAIAFGEQSAGVSSTTPVVNLYNGGNQPLTVSSVAFSGAPFTLVTGGTNGCTAGFVIAPGASCGAGVSITPPHAGLYSGTVTFTTDSLNTASTVQTVALSAFVYGVYMVPSPTTLNFLNQKAGTTSPASTVMLTNEGDYYAGTIGTPTSSNPAFNATIGTCTVSIDVGSNCQLNVTFSPTLAQPYSGTITVPASSEGGGVTPSATFTVNGMGIN